MDMQKVVCHCDADFMMDSLNCEHYALWGK